MPQICATCRHWNDESGTTGHCQRIEDERPPETPVKGAWIEGDGRRGQMSLTTSANFGCVLHEEKE